MHKAASPVLIPGTAEAFTEAGSPIMQHDPEGQSKKLFKKHWLTFFDVKVGIIVDAWGRMDITLDDPYMNGAKPCHLLWTLLFLKKYRDEAEMASLCMAVDEKTY